MLEFTFSWVAILALVVSVILPILVGLVTTRVASSRTRAIALALLAAVTGFGTELLNALVNALPYDLFAGLVLAVTAFLIAVALHFGFWKPVGVSEAAINTGGFIN